MSTKDQDDYDAFCHLQPAPRWEVFKSERDRADKAEADIGEWQDASGLEGAPAGDPGDITPEIARKYWTGIEDEKEAAIAELHDSKNWARRFTSRDQMQVQILELKEQLEQVSTGRAISMTLQLKTRKVAHSIGCLTAMLQQLPDEVKQGLSPEVAGVIQEWLADQLETVATPGDPS